MKLNQDDYNSLVSRFEYENVRAKCGKTKIWEIKKQKLLRVEIDRSLRFDEYIIPYVEKPK